MKAAKTNAPNVILITIDALRRDHLGCYGYYRNTSPNIDSLAQRSVVFEQAITNAPYTKASFKSIMTSTYPFSFGGYHTIKPRLKIAEVLKQNGYYTAAFPTIPILSASSGYADGFDVSEDPFKKADSPTKIRWRLQKIRRYIHRKFGFDTIKLYFFYRMLYNFIHLSPQQYIPYARGDIVTQELISTLTNNKDHRLFIWTHYMDVHDPYNPVIQMPDESHDYLSAREIYKLNVKLRKSDLPRKKEDKMAIPRAELKKLINLYDGEIKYVDEQIGSLLVELKKLHLLENTLIIITADHGESFWEHGTLGHLGINHYTHMYDELLRVPLIISHPQLGRHLIRDQVSLLDIAPTIVDMLGLPQVKQFQGKTLLPLINGKEKREGGVISEASVFNKFKGMEVVPVDDPRIVSYRTQDWKYIYNERGQDELYHLENDPGETQNIIDAEPEITAELRAKIMAHIEFEDRSTPGERELIKARVRKLKDGGKI
jgi:arylsulfatase A-like enzyme